MWSLGLVGASATLALLPLAAVGQDEDVSPEIQRIFDCYEAKDWDCAFDGLVTELGKDGRVDQCIADPRHGCAYEMIMLYETGIGAAGPANPVRRRDVSDRALGLLRPMSQGGIDAEGELYFSALRYVACRAMGDVDCAAVSADMVRLAVSNGYDAEDTLFGESEVRYPLDLDAIIAEIGPLEHLK